MRHVTKHDLTLIKDKGLWLIIFIHTRQLKYREVLVSKYLNVTLRYNNNNNNIFAIVQSTVSGLRRYVKIQANFIPCDYLETLNFSFFPNLHFWRRSNFFGHFLPSPLWCRLIMRNFRRNPRPQVALQSALHGDQAVTTQSTGGWGVGFLYKIKWLAWLRLLKVS